MAWQAGSVTSSAPPLTTDPIRGVIGFYDVGDPDQRRKALREALRPPLTAGDLDATLQAVRDLRLRDPGHDTAQQVVEALELLMAQARLSADGGEEELAAAAAMLSRGQLAPALEIYRAVHERDATERIGELVTRLELVLHAASEDLDEPKEAPSELEALLFDEATAAIPQQEIPAAAFRPDQPFRPDEFGDEPTMHLSLGDYQLVDQEQGRAENALKPLPAPDEPTRVVDLNELPLDELRQQIAAERSDAEINGLLDRLDPDAPQSAAAEPPAPGPPAPAPPGPPAPAPPPEPATPPAATPPGPPVPATPTPDAAAGADAEEAAPAPGSQVSADPGRGPVVPRAPTFAPAPEPEPEPELPVDVSFEPRGSHPPPEGFRPPPAPLPAVGPDPRTSRPPAAPPPAEPTPVPRGSHPPEPEFRPPPAPLPSAPAPVSPRPDEFVIPPASALGSGDPIHAPLDTTDVALPDPDGWVTVPDSSVPPAATAESVVGSPGEKSWIGLRAFQDEPSAFEPGVGSVDEDHWADEVPTQVHQLSGEPGSVQRAEALAARGELGAALGMYQDLAEKSPDDPRLWQRIEELARALQRKSTPPKA